MGGAAPAVLVAAVIAEAVMPIANGFEGGEDLIGLDGKTLVELDGASGKRVESYAPKLSVETTRRLDGGRVVAATSDGKVVLLDASGAEQATLGRVTRPVIDLRAGAGHVVVAGRGELSAFPLP
ncbi:MAG: hypothetical protein IT385_23805 [Deltaproteobacteria bacterium]|nr:hypothetical protein [Deltaproteobacteria bacterium]